MPKSEYKEKGVEVVKIHSLLNVVESHNIYNLKSCTISNSESLKMNPATLFAFFGMKNRPIHFWDLITLR